MAIMVTISQPTSCTLQFLEFPVLFFNRYIRQVWKLFFGEDKYLTKNLNS